MSDFHALLDCTGLLVTPRAVGCRGDAVLSGADKRGTECRGQGSSVETAQQYQHRPQQCRGRVRPEVRMKCMVEMNVQLKLVLFT